MLGASFRDRLIQVVGRGAHHRITVSHERFELSRQRYVQMLELGLFQISNVFERTAISEFDPFAETAGFQQRSDGFADFARADNSDIHIYPPYEWLAEANARGSVASI